MDYSRRAVLAALAGGPVLMAVTGSNPVVGGTNLARARINSPDYVAGSTGWTINQDGSAEFNNLTIRGTFFGTDYIINSTGLFFYTPSEALGNLAISISPGGGTGPFGETVPAGIELYGTGGTARLLLSTKDASELAAGVLTTLINGAGSSRALTTILTSPDFVANTQAELLLQSPSFDGTTSPSTAELLATKILLNGAITGTTGTASTPTLITTDSWNQVSPGGTWTNSGSGVNGFFYRLQTDNTVALAWDVSNNNANPGTLGTLPAAYRPATTVRLQSGWGGTGPTSYNDQFSPMIQVASNGNITGGGLFVATLILFGTAIFPLGSL